MLGTKRFRHASRAQEIGLPAYKRQTRKRKVAPQALRPDALANSAAQAASRALTLA